MEENNEVEVEPGSEFQSSIFSQTPTEYTQDLIDSLRACIGNADWCNDVGYHPLHHSVIVIIDIETVKQGNYRLGNELIIRGASAPESKGYLLSDSFCEAIISHHEVKSQ